MKWVLSFAFVATILVMQGSDPIGILNLTLSRVQAFIVIAMIYLATCLATLAHFRRIAFLMAGLAPREIALGFDKLASHKWLLNPFVLEGRATPHGALALGVLTCLFWLCLATLYALLPGEAWRGPLAVFLEQGWLNPATWIHIGVAFAYLVPVGLFIVIGDFSLKSILQVVTDSADRVPLNQLEMKERLQQYAVDLKKAADHGIAAGGIVLMIVLALTPGISFWWRS